MKKIFTDLLFITLCIPTRLLMVYITKHIKPKYLPYLAFIGLTISIGFFYQYIIPQTRTKGTFGQAIWWQPYRPIHTITFLVFAILAFKKKNYAYIPLLIDVLIGITMFTIL